MRRAEAELTLTLVDQRLIIYNGESPLEQEFPTIAALVEHAQRVVKLRQADGFRVVAERSGDEIVMPPDPKAPPADAPPKP